VGDDQAQACICVRIIRAVTDTEFDCSVVLHIRWCIHASDVGDTVMRLLSQRRRLVV
jgi:hypothetical protein